jgi:Uma2 family endonuclease
MTATLETPPVRDQAQPNLEPHRFTGAEYRRMYEAGIFAPTQRSQLIRGEIYFMAAMGRAHHHGLRVLGKLLYRLYAERTEITQQSPIVVWNDSEPEPDFALVRSDFGGGVPKARDVLLAIEVSDSTLKFDRTVKLPDYARSGIAETWILNLKERQLEVYRQPSGEKYLSLQILEGTMPATPLFAPDTVLEWWTALETVSDETQPSEETSSNE